MRPFEWRLGVRDAFGGRPLGGILGPEVPGDAIDLSEGGGPFTVLTGLTPADDTTLDGQSAWSGDQSRLGWQLVTGSLAAYAGRTVRIQLSFRSDGTLVQPGVYIDEVRVLR
jgi:large repetitive protein